MFRFPRPSLRSPLLGSPLAFFCNLLLSYVLFGLCRLVFLLSNWSVFSVGWSQLSLAKLLEASFLFDTSALLYLNSLYALLMLLPLHFKERHTWQLVARWTYLLPNALALVSNLVDVVYFRYTGRRSTISVFREFGAESNLWKILGQELLRYWWLLLVGLVLLALLRCLYTQPLRPRGESRVARPLWRYYLVQLLCFGLFVPLCVGGMRGGFTTAVRPITLSNANQYVNRPAEAALVLNTPFSMIRTVGKRAFEVPQFYSASQLEALYTPIHQPAAAEPMQRKNVVVLILESFGAEYSGRLNPHLDGGRYKGYTPFLDSLMSVSATWEHSFSNGRKSIDGMPSILSSIPMFVEPFFLTPASLNHLSGLAGELRREGYATAFFHGAQNGSMGFQAFARATGFSQYFGRTEYEADRRFGGSKDFDGTWAIWDGPFLQYYARQMSALRQPFMTAVFTASSHAPYRVPDSLAARYPEEGAHPLLKCVRYSDQSLREFFATARRQPWYDNTIFVLTADHTSLTAHPEYETPLGLFRVPIVFFDPSGQMPAGQRRGIAKQIDIMPTVLGYLRYPRPYLAFGSDLTRTAPSDTWEVAYNNGVYLFVQGDYVLSFDGEHSTALHRYTTDPLMQRNLLGRVPQQRAMERKLKAIIQSYMQRMTTDRVVAGR